MFISNLLFVQLRGGLGYSCKFRSSEIWENQKVIFVQFFSGISKNDQKSSKDFGKCGLLTGFKKLVIIRK